MRRPAPRKPRKQITDPAIVRQLADALPRPSAIGRRRFSQWLKGLVGTADGRALASLVGEHRKLSELLAGIAETAPYLWDLIEADPSRALRFFTSDPEQSLAGIVKVARNAARSARAPAKIARILRRAKADAALLSALTDTGGVWSVAQVTGALTQIADVTLGLAIQYLLREAAARKKFLPVDPRDPAAGSGYVVLAMGKMGGGELNFSSDIDLMVFFDPAAGRLAADIEPGQFYVRLTRDLVKLLQERTADGYVFRVDLRLRPDPSSTQIAISMDAAIDYYESRGQTWERAALIKARPSAGDLAAGERLLGALAPFIWRKYLDYAAVADVHAMKQQIHAYRGHGEIAVEGHNIKLGRGGIREIEFFVQTQQLIAGGRHLGLRGRETIATLVALAAGGWIDAATCAELSAAYDFLRRVEHRLQMMADEQTHTLPTERDALEIFARFLGFADGDAFAAELLKHLRAVEKHYVRLFESAPALLAQQQNLSFAAGEGEDDHETLDRLTEIGFRQPRELVAAVRRWQAGSYRALHGEQARKNLTELIPVVIDQFSKAENPDKAFAALDYFLAGLRAGGRLLSLLRQNPELVRFIALILGTAPRLTDILSQYPHVIDPLIDPSFFGALPDAKRLRAELAGLLADTPGYEAMLDAIRLFGQENMFLIGARILSGSLSAEQAGDVFAGLADVLVGALHTRVEADFAAAHGHLRGQETAIVALGRLGGREMTASSDLDLIVVYDFDAAYPNSDGERSLYGAQYFARLTQRLISALTVQTNYGVLYHVDMRLRPSGRSGPLATHIDSFTGYQEHEAWTWEHMALTRARVISASPAFAARVEAAIHAVLKKKRDAHKAAADVVEMRGAIANEKGDADPWDLKYAAGGLVDIEFIAQYLQLVHAAAAPDILDTSTVRTLEKAARAGILKPEDATILRPAVLFLQDLTQILRLCLPGAFDPKTAGAGVLALLARAADLPDFPALQAYLTETQRQVRECFVRILGKAP
ncbi:MAG TPA: bifunctional [glutamine synthetase] adenylyltransferase/[glutamine synthetase]-adenylyl-L-tyrosine phosphorylase [Xanthobacteraceae bacterium]|nr:bifunctional [glutamine synthetase] adenylyltransferase/[glutamine synthetase]-adenylyl-L-tyrosine phosphorylase [Xanthobacteraceae bacterium]